MSMNRCSAALFLEEILRADRERVKAVQKVAEYIARIQERGLRTEGLYLYGKFGTGKTFLMGYMLYELARTAIPA